jgi:hypothetical protein
MGWGSRSIARCGVSASAGQSALAVFVISFLTFDA